MIPNAFTSINASEPPTIPPPFLWSRLSTNVNNGGTTSLPYVISENNTHKNTAKRIAAASFSIANAFPLFDTAKKLPAKRMIGKT